MHGNGHASETLVARYGTLGRPRIYLSRWASMSFPDLTRLTTLTFDCYGTLIDWETGAIAVLRPFLLRHGIALSYDEIITTFQDIDGALCQPPYKSYRAVLAGVVEGFGRRLGFPVEAADREVLVLSVASWRPFPDTVEALRALGGRYRLAIISNIDDALFATTIKQLVVEFDVVVTSGKQKRYPALTLTVIQAEERGTPKNRKKIDWKLIADLPVGSRSDAIEKLEWYALRWKIEVFHKILKSGCKAEESKLRTAQRLTNLISLFCILSWRVFWMTMLNRSAPDAPPTLALTATEARSPRQRQTKSKTENAVALSDQDRPARRLSRPRQRSAPRQYRHVARAVTPHRHRGGRRGWRRIYG